MESTNLTASTPAMFNTTEDPTTTASSSIDDTVYKVDVFELRWKNTDLYTEYVFKTKLSSGNRWAAFALSLDDKMVKFLLITIIFVFSCEIWTKGAKSIFARSFKRDHLEHIIFSYILT